MQLIEALAHQSPIPITVVKAGGIDSQIGRQFRWCNGHIQTRVNEKKTWHRLINFPSWWLEYMEIDDNEIL